MLAHQFVHGTACFFHNQPSSTKTVTRLVHSIRLIRSARKVPGGVRAVRDNSIEVGSRMRRLRSWLQRVRRACLRAPFAIFLTMLAILSQGDEARGQASKIIAKAATSRAAREDAIRGIPFRSLSPHAQRRIAAVVKKPTMFRRMPITVIQCDPELHRFSVRHPEVIVSVWQMMGITQVSVSRIGPYVLQCDDGVGTKTDMELIYGDRDTHIIFCEGSYEGPLFRKPLTGRCVLVLKSGAVNGPGGYHITNMMDVFVQVDHAGVDLFTKTLHPLLGKSADVNFTESMRFLERMSIAAENNGAGMQDMVTRLQNLQSPVRKRFKQVVSNVNQRHQALTVRNASGNESPNRTTPTLPARAAIRRRSPTIRSR